MTTREAVRSFTIPPLARTAHAAGRAGQATEADRMRAALLAAAGLEPEETPGGGLTITMSMPAAGLRRRA
jgi:hypothetical protein